MERYAVIDGFINLKSKNKEDIEEICKYFIQWRISKIYIGEGNLISSGLKNNITYEYEGSIVFGIDIQNESMNIEITDWDDTKVALAVPVCLYDKIFVKEQTLEIFIDVINGIKIKLDSYKSYKKALAYLYVICSGNYRKLDDTTYILSKFKEVNIDKLPDVKNIFYEYFYEGAIKELIVGDVMITYFGREEAVECNIGNIVLKVCIDDFKGSDIEYAKAIYEPRNVRLNIKVKEEEKEGLELFEDIVYDTRILGRKDNFEIYIEHSYGSINFKFDCYEKYKITLAYIMIASMKKDCSYLVKNSEKNIVFEDNIYEESPYDKLNNLIGMNTIKADVMNMVNLMRMQTNRQKQGLKEIPISLHLVFSGNPGTGKTTVARILADIYKDIGILSKGHLIEVDRSGLVAGYVGQTAIKTQEKIDEAMGGILFIDEAYTLAKDGDDYGQEAIDTILKAMEDNRNDFVVIVAGYSQLMHKFINSNPGLRSRFNKYIDFPDYNAEELVQIFISLCKKYDYNLTNDAKRTAENIIFIMEKNKDENFANARDIRNLFEKVITKQATRVAEEGFSNMLEIIAEDFE